MMAVAGIAALASRAGDAAAMLKLIANEQRLRLLCRLSEGEVPVSALVELTGLSQSSVSQHLARLRAGGMVGTRREGTTIFYRLANDEVRQLVGVLGLRFGRPEAMPASRL